MKPIPSSKNKWGYCGVQQVRLKCGDVKYIAATKHNGKKLVLGRYSTPEQAGSAYARALSDIGTSLEGQVGAGGRAKAIEQVFTTSNYNPTGYECQQCGYDGKKGKCPKCTSGWCVPIKIRKFVYDSEVT